MGKMIGAAEFKAHCLRILDEVERTGEPVTITKRGKPVGVLRPAPKEEKRLFFGCMKNSGYRFDDPFSPAIDPSEVHANDPAKWDDLP
ncbi:type II toxin-antitoxin system Phd/YefM family antitoxin [Sphingosinicella sp. LHD-64]|uniref:type II toxin-antitoxin system Phd/YefM family antitoxin n=1 Tax=Sphingosinicella sp. LHD-64 TaxID=3072139 RepID=UPI00280E3D95|nr:type II toxin-antitoxin system Phd/YefM family antitoxin [Sphingosinicella sp. LHD-64]MDQ8756067.1 type II toxin-antitoxin system Phd/YefM family antitoxin [Sphingosinicella sp. LHD-64]